MDRFDVLCVGIAVADVMAKAIDEIPEWDRLGTFDHIEHHIGGCAVNTAVDLQQLGVRAAVSACVGRDATGDFIRKSLAASGVDTEGLVDSDAAATSYAFVMIGSDGRRRYLHRVGANAVFSEADVPDALIAQARILHIGGALLMPAMDGPPTARLLARARGMGVLTSMDTAFNPNVDAAGMVEPCLPHLDLFLPSIEEAQAITGESEPQRILDALDGRGIGTLGVKLGADGCLIRSGGETRHHAIFEVDVVDGSGAGDAFFAGYLYGVLQGWSADDSARFANATAAHCIQAIGCSAGVPTAEVVQEFVRAGNR